jgi:hypothetical protein
MNWDKMFISHLVNNQPRNSYLEVYIWTYLSVFKKWRLIFKNMWVDVDKIVSKKIDVDKIWSFISIQPQKMTI